jgi:hypothetical protein
MVRHGIWVLLAAAVVACSATVETESSPACDPAAKPPCGTETPLCVDGAWTCNTCDPIGAGAADCWDECHGMHSPHCEAGHWACLDPEVGGCSAVGGASSGGGGAGGIGASGGVGGMGGISGNCAALSEAIATETGIVGACVTVVRLDYQSLAILGFQIFCGPFAHPDEATARATAQADAGYGSSAQLLGGPFPTDEWVFWQPAGDFGGTGVVGAAQGLTVFGGSTIWSGTGDITYPVTWRPAADLGPSCVPTVNALPPEARGFDLDSGQPLGAGEITTAMDKAWNTALPDVLWANSYVFPSMVLRYPRSTGAFDPATAEWIVLLNSGWLE